MQNVFGQEILIQRPEFLHLINELSQTNVPKTKIILWTDSLK